MTATFGKLRKTLFGISLDEVRVERRGFGTMTQPRRDRLEAIGAAFVEGYHAALLEGVSPALSGRLEAVEQERRGFAHEGAAMGLALLDLLTPGRSRRLGDFLDGPGAAHAYMVHVGAGWAMARLPWGLTYFRHLDPLLGWLALDGYGFHQGYFHGPAAVDGQQRPKRLGGYQQRAFDQGVGRSLWFVRGADVGQIAATIAGFPEARRADLWSGVGLAAAYAGGVGAAELDTLRRLAEPYWPELAQGAAFAAKARFRAGNPTAHTELACEALCQRPAAAAALLTDQALEDLPVDTRDYPAYEVWRRRIQVKFREDLL